MNNLQHHPEVSVELKSSYTKPDKEIEVGRGASTMWQIVPEKILNTTDYKSEIYFPKWENKIFIIPCAFAVFFNPLFFYLPVVYPDQLCYKWDVNLMWIYVIVQSTIDLFYAMDIYVFCCRIRGKQNVNMTDKEHILLWLPIIYRINLFLPISQAVILLRYVLKARFLYRFLRRFFYPIQYALRSYCTFGLIKRRPNVESGIGRWLQAILDLLPFIIASHLVGALCYGFAVDREIHCWRTQYHMMQCDKSVKNSFYCHKSTTDEVFRTCNVTHIKEFCYGNDRNDFRNFGIYRVPIQSNFTRSCYFPRKFMLSFWWGLRNLSSFGSNLETSSNMLEICFTILTSISGLVLFLIYLNARVEESQKRKDSMKLRQKMQTMNPDIDMWLTRNNISRSDKKKMKKVIMKNVLQKLEENKDVDLQNFLSLLPKACKRQIKNQSRLTCLEKVTVFKCMTTRVLKAIAKHLEFVTYTKNHHIIREGEPLWSVLIITQGTVLSHKPRHNIANNVGETNKRGDSSFIKKYDLFGDELLEWAFQFSPISDLPISSRIVISQTRVEGYIISAENLKRVVSKFGLHFLLNVHVLEDSPLERMAASSLQAWWRERGSGNLWNKLRELHNNLSSEGD